MDSTIEIEVVSKSNCTFYLLLLSKKAYFTNLYKMLHNLSTVM